MFLSLCSGPKGPAQLMVECRDLVHPMVYHSIPGPPCSTEDHQWDLWAPYWVSALQISSCKTRMVIQVQVHSGLFIIEVFAPPLLFFMSLLSCCVFVDLVNGLMDWEVVETLWPLWWSRLVTVRGSMLCLRRYLAVSQKTEVQITLT